jgi:3-oxo-5alpha-steroid 4-dehydrogenase
MLSLGGLIVDEKSGEVKREDGSTIEGLYAAGRNAVGLPSRGYVSGLAIADCVLSARRAATHATAKDSDLRG